MKTSIFNSATAEIVPLPRKPGTLKASERKFGKPVMDYGFCITPSLLMQAQARIGINPVQFNIILHLLDIWWEADRRPWPTKQLIADRMKMSPRQIQRQIAELEGAGFVTRIGRTRAGRGKTSNEYDLSGLVRRLKELEPEFTKMKRENQVKRRNLEKPQIRHAHA